MHLSGKDTFNEIECDREFINLSFWEATTMDWKVKPQEEVIAKLTVLTIICIVGIIGNLSVIIVILSQPLLRGQAINAFLLSMSTSDLLSLLICPFLYVHKQQVLFRFYVLNKISCKMTPFLTQLFMLSGAFSLTTISLIRATGILFTRTPLEVRSPRYIYGIIAIIWIAALAAASPTLFYRRYWCREWSDLIEVNCDDSLSNSLPYWLISLTIVIWIPTIIMLVSYGLIRAKIRKSSKRFPYLTDQSRQHRNRTKLIRMLYVLLVVQIVCWLPWQTFTFLDASTRGKDQTGFVRKFLPLLQDIKFFMIFFNSAINPILYGYCSENIRKAFRLTFSCLFKGEPKYRIQKANMGPNTFNFIKYHRKYLTEKAIIGTGTTTIAPLEVNHERQDISTISQNIILVSKPESILGNRYHPCKHTTNGLKAKIEIKEEL